MMEVVICFGLALIGLCGCSFLALLTNHRLLKTTELQSQRIDLINQRIDRLEERLK